MTTSFVVAAVAGAFNGLLVTKFGLPSLAVTIGTLTLYRGIAVIILGPSTISNFPARYTDIGINANIPFAAALATIPVAVMGVYLVIARRLGAFEAL